MRLNAINRDVPPGAWAHAAVMIGAVLDEDLKAFESAANVPTRWENEALASLAAAFLAELADARCEPPADVLQRTQQEYAALR
jgi:hypothetical protein